MLHLFGPRSRWIHSEFTAPVGRHIDSGPKTPFGWARWKGKGKEGWLLYFTVTKGHSVKPKCCCTYSFNRIDQAEELENEELIQSLDALLFNSNDSDESKLEACERDGDCEELGAVGATADIFSTGSSSSTASETKSEALDDSLDEDDFYANELKDFLDDMMIQAPNMPFQHPRAVMPNYSANMPFQSPYYHHHPHPHHHHVSRGVITLLLLLLLWNVQWPLFVQFFSSYFNVIILVSEWWMQERYRRVNCQSSRHLKSTILHAI